MTPFVMLRAEVPCFALPPAVRTWPRGKPMVAAQRLKPEWGRSAFVTALDGDVAQGQRR